MTIFKHVAHRRLLLGAATAFVVALAGQATLDKAGAAVPRAQTWGAAAAARYLDMRLAWWRQWPKAQRTHDTMCVSCHTALPGMLARPVLRAALGDRTRSPAEIAMFDDVTKRVYLWNEIGPFYYDQKSGAGKTGESRGVESVLNALFLVTRDNERGAVFGSDTRQAFAQMWALQMQTGDTKGGFPWLNFHLEPWESPSATYWGAPLAALARARAPARYSADPAIAPNVEALRGYLRGGLTGQSLYSRMLVLIADSELHGIATPEQRAAVVAEVLAAQGPDGGWALPALAPWQRVDKTALPTTSDGYATAISAFMLREVAHETTSPADAAALEHAKRWLVAHQDKATGSIPAKSINKDRADTDAYLFMTDHATGIAALVMRPGV